MTAPLYEHLMRYADKNRISFAMPGHKNGRGLAPDLIRLDVTELDATENLYDGGKYVAEANRLLSALYGSDESIILTGGSTACVQAMICGTVNKNGTLLAAANCHKSVINLCTLSGIKVRFFDTAAEIKDLLSQDIRAVIITSPDYYGRYADVKGIASLCHKKNIPLLVDEAHGAHFISFDKFPETAVHYADAVCHSAHKTLNAFNGAAYLHLNKGLIDLDRIKRALNMFVSSSPSYIIASSADTARAEIESGGGWDEAYYMCEELRERIKKKGIGVLENDDITRLVLDFSGYDTTGFEVSRILSERGIDIEMADLFNIVLIVTPSNTREDLDTLFLVLCDIAKSLEKRKNKIIITPPPVCSETLSPSLILHMDYEEINLSDAVGRTAYDTVVPYPPGVPVIFTGETIRPEQTDYISRIENAGGKTDGIRNGKLKVVK